MKKYLKIITIVICTFALVLALVACNPECTEHVDEDGDAKCDVCGADLSPACEHVDANYDEKCDKCGASVSLNDGKETYSIFISNGMGGVYSDVLVEFYDGTQKVLMVSTGADGYAYARLPLNVYDVKMIDTLSRNLYFGENLKVTPSKKNLEVNAYVDIASEKTMTIMNSPVMKSVISGEPNTTYAYALKGEGAYRMEVETSLMTPFVWTAERGGIYTFTFESEFGSYVSYHGQPVNVLENNIVDDEDQITDNSLKMTITSLNLAHGENEATPYVFGIKGKTEGGFGVLKIVRIGDAPIDLAEIPWNKYPTQIPGTLNLSEDLTTADLNYLSLTTNQQIVYNENDGLYHLGSANGKIVYVQLKFTPPTMRDRVGDEPENFFTLEAAIVNGNFGVYKFDGEGNLLEKVSYTEHALACLEKAHETAGIYYLTTGMMNAIKDIGEKEQWWDFDSERHVFGEKANVSVLEEYAWMFCLCTID